MKADTCAERRSKLASSCQELARNISYNAEGVEPTIKHTLLEASRELDRCAVHVRRAKGVVEVVNARGKSRPMTWRERFAFAIIGKLEIAP